MLASLAAVSVVAGPASHAHPVASKRPRNQTPHAYAAFCVGVPAVAQCPPPSHAGRGEYSGSVLLSYVRPPLREAQTPASAGRRRRMVRVLGEWNGEEGPEARALGAGAVGVGGCARLRWSAAGMRSVSSARLRCARTLWTVSGRHQAPRPRDRRPRPARLLESLSPPADRPRVPCLRRACRLQPAHLVAWRPLTATADAAGSLGHTPRNPSELPEAVAV